MHMRTSLTFVIVLIAMLMTCPLTTQAQSKSKTTVTDAKLTPEQVKELAVAKKEASKLTSSQKFKLLDILNKGDKEAVMELPGIGKSRAVDVIKARPFNNVEDLILIKGIGQKSLTDIVTFGKTLTERRTKSTKKKK